MRVKCEGEGQDDKQAECHISPCLCNCSCSKNATGDTSTRPAGVSEAHKILLPLGFHKAAWLRNAKTRWPDATVSVKP